MPYIAKERRAILDQGLDQPSNAGELAYVLTAVVERYHRHLGQRFQTMSDVLGAIESTKDEYQRCVVRPHEDQRRIENGAIYPNQ